jgi:three-Cys-motif partner protein
MSTVKTLHNFSKDDFIVTAVEPWFKVKVQVIQDYFQAFLGETTGRVDEIVLVDFFAGSGFYAIGHQKEIVPMSSLLGFRQDPPFSKIILREPEPESAKALRVRVNKYFRGRNSVIFEEGVEDMIDKLKLYIPPSKKNYKVATLCLLDPFSINFQFSAIEKLAEMGYSFLVPYTLMLNSRTDYRYYQKEKREELKCFIGPNESSVMAANNNTEFYKKLVRSHQNNMLALGLSVSLSAHKLESKYMDMPMFYVGLFSKQVSAKTVGRDVKESMQQQIELF